MRIQAKIAEVERYCDELQSILPKDFAEYAKDLQKRAACERYFEKIIDAVVDVDTDVAVTEDEAGTVGFAVLVGALCIRERSPRRRVG